MPKDTWSPEQKDFLLENKDSLTATDIGEKLGKTEMAVNLYMLRHHIVVGPVVKRNLVRELLNLKFKKHEYFSPTRIFYQEVRISQKRWWDIYRGRSQLTEDEYIRLIEYFDISLKDAFEARQLNLFTEDEK